MNNETKELIAMRNKAKEVYAETQTIFYAALEAYSEKNEPTEQEENALDLAWNTYHKARSEYNKAQEQVLFSLL